MEVTGKLIKILETKSGTSKTSGKEWAKNSFIIQTTEEYNNLYCFELFGADKVNDFLSNNKVGNELKVQFNVSTNEWKGSYYTALQAWKIDIVNSATAPDLEIIPEDSDNDLPF